MALTKKIGEPEKVEPRHVDDFIDYGSWPRGDNDEKHEDYARWVLNYFRHSAICKEAFKPFMAEHKLFCSYKGKPYRVIGASRLGDIWLTSDFGREHGYEHRVNVDDCSKWAKCSLDAA